MAPHSSTLAWKIPWREEPGGQSRTRLKQLSSSSSSSIGKKKTHTNIWRINNQELFILNNQEFSEEIKRE